MRPAENIESLVKKLRYKASATTHDRVLGNVLQALDKPEKRRPAVTGPNIWRIIMKSKMTKCATAAVIAAVVVLSIIFLDKSVTPVYAIEQTIDAGRDISHLHFKYFRPSQNEAAKEAWLEYDAAGQIKNVRVNWYSWGEQDMVMVWKRDKAQMWLKKEKTLKFFEDELYTAKILFFVQSYDPTRAVENLHKLREKGDVEIKIDEPSNRTDPIVITATYKPNTFLLEGPMPQMREILFVDQATKLVRAIEIYELKEGEYIDRGVWRYHEYDRPFNAGIFNLEDEVPADVKHLDLMVLDVGLEQGDLTKEEIALKVAREFFKAWIAKDYARAIRIHGYEDPDQKAEMQKKFEKLNVVRIISIGEPFPPPPDRSRGCLGIPCTLEVEKDGEVVEWQLDDLFVGRVRGYPNRWRIGEFELP